jgi:two-component system, chemotaxis family, sensor kinase CheA
MKKSWFLQYDASLLFEVVMNQSNDIRETFYAECDDLIEALTDGLDEIDACLGTGVVDGEIINAVFRAVHSIKGGAGAFGLETLVRFAHCFETTLDAVRSGKLQISAELMVIFHRSSDHLSELIIASRDSGTPNMDKSAELIEQLKSVLDDDPLASSPDTAETFEFTPLVLNFDSEEDTSASHPDEYFILFSASKSLYANGNEPLFLLNALARLGTSTVSVATERLPPLDEMDVQEAYLDWTINLFTAEPESAIREVFEFVEGSCKIDIRRSTLQSALHDFTDEVSDYSSDVSSCQVATEPASVREDLSVYPGTS